jgi:hypothetical protein
LKLLDLTLGTITVGVRVNPSSEDLNSERNDLVMLLNGLTVRDYQELPGLYIGIINIMLREWARSSGIEPDELWSDLAVRITAAAEREL